MLPKSIKLYRDLRALTDQGIVINLENDEPLLPCPFCGGAAKMRYAAGAYGVIAVEIYCTRCFTKSDTNLIGVGVLRPGSSGWEPQDEPEAIKRTAEAWNTRI